MKVTDIIAVEWSPKDKNFHISPLGKVIENNATSIIGGTQPGYVVVGVFATGEEADAFIAKMSEDHPDIFGSDS